ncbi:hypothetical protein AB0I61_13600 [Polymorphospora rubra]|uniref:hypothetical protein n=1 Tax=Polymorphospora rubra TaxID=338584 RepID=UPI0033D02A02
MQPNVPFRLIEVLATSRVGKTWAGVDPAGRQLTVAVLDEAVAADPGWRSAFEQAAGTMTQPHGEPTPLVGANFAAATPWIAVLADGGPGATRIFQILGFESVDRRPVDPTVELSTASQQPPFVPPISAPPVSTPPGPPPVSGPPGHQPPVPGAAGYQPPVSGPPGYQPPAPGAAGYPPVSGPPGSYSPDQPVSGQPSSPAWNAQPPPPYSDQPRIPPLRNISRPRRSRKGMWAVLAVVVVLALAGGATAVAMTVLKDGETPVTQPSAAAPSSVPVIPTPSPQQPGLEPPRAGDWPRWPAFGPVDNPQPQALDGTGLALVLPPSWTCRQAATDAGATRYNCGAATTNGDEVGGEITVRTCERPCNVERRDEMRKAEEAWGQQWRYAGDYAAMAETKTVDGSARYGLVVVAYWRSTPDEAIDRQLVFRMTAPEAWTDDIRKVANAAKDAARF